MSRPYFTLLQLEDDRWCVAFGDYFKSVVRAELEDMRSSGTPRKRLQIIQTGELQSEINAAVAHLNRRPVHA